MLTVLDTNVVISALLFRGESAAVYQAVISGSIIPLVSPTILDEYVRVLGYPKLGLTDTEIRYLIDKEIGRWFRVLTDSIPADAWIPEDPSDDRFINAARVRPGTILISTDRHVLGIRDTLPVRVLTVRELTEELLKARPSRIVVPEPGTT